MGVRLNVKVKSKCRLYLCFQSFFEYEDQKQYIYKEPKGTSLPELCDRLKTLYGTKVKCQGQIKI